MNNDFSQEQLGIVGRSPKIQEIMKTVRQIAGTDITVLLTGESGVGKEVFARALHRLSKRADKRMISINCGAIPETLLESELFGHEKGAFTGAVETRKGLFEAANGGTLFLDEIGEMSLATQVKLLRVLETLEFTRVGSTESQKTDVRVIAATNRNLTKEVERGKFRNDLFYRLHSAEITIPPLRERKEDIPLLIAYYAFDTAQKLNIQFGGITEDALNVLVEYPWPGNVRELRNFIELIITLGEGKQITEEIVYEHLDTSRARPQDNPGAIVHLAGRTPEEAERELLYRALIDLRNEVSSLKQMIRDLARGSSRHEDEQNERNMTLPALPPRPSTPEQLVSQLNTINLEEVERLIILSALERYGENRRKAADALGISERTLYRKLQQYRDDGTFREDEPGNGSPDVQTNHRHTESSER